VPRNVAVVLVEDFSDRLEKLAFRTPVWLVDTPPNRASAEEAWRAAVEWPHITVTLFRASDDWPTLLGQIELRDRIDALEVIGASLAPETHTALVDAGFTKFDETADGFRAKRV
jgi:hypothetical protein